MIVAVKMTNRSNTYLQWAFFHCSTHVIIVGVFFFSFFQIENTLFGNKALHLFPKTSVIEKKVQPLATLLEPFHSLWAHVLFYYPFYSPPSQFLSSTSTLFLLFSLFSPLTSFQLFLTLPLCLPSVLSSAAVKSLCSKRALLSEKRPQRKISGTEWGVRDGW